MQDAERNDDIKSSVMYMRAHRLTEEKHWPCEYALDDRVEERREDEKIQGCDMVDHPYLPDLAR